MKLKPIKVHPLYSINFTDHARTLCESLNEYVRMFPNTSFSVLADLFNLSETNARRYYYGIHHVNGEAVKWKKGYTQMRRGACVPL